ncbi:hypothetical protein SAMN05444339_101566 [Loktanella atrilutea]|uniref:Uncharacterized protein n=1 Tax=Loktanella atrilutea TaxID=366533 RepID=A0A1M4U1R5_LOKAT|nr:hypothetical protein [Loktanella atrilutea]SHE50613.1 hypothetical protein SAMN05444339_101566 [Loktanella atrilutea]
MTLIVRTDRDGDATLDVVVDDKTTLTAIAPRSFIDEQIDEGANGNAVSSWFMERSEDVEKAVKAISDGRSAEPPFDRLTFKGRS